MKNRHSIRLINYDYSTPGLYSITICTQNRACYYGEIKDHQMILNDAGDMVKGWIYKISEKYNDKILHEHTIMPNHVHFILENTNNGIHDQSNKKKVALGEAIGWLKAMTTNNYIKGVKQKRWQRFEKKLWQRNYWEHVIRNEKDYLKLAEYILNNLIKWDEDMLNPRNM